MPDVSWETRLDRVRMEVPQCPRELMVSEIIRVARDFCQHSRAYQFEVTDESILQLVSDYDIEVPSAQVQPISVEYLSVDGVESEFKDLSWIQQFIGNNWRERSADDFRFFTQIQPLAITFPCVPTVNGTVGGLHYRVSLKPKLDSTTIDETFMEEWQEALEVGTKAHLMAMDGKPWHRQTRSVFLMGMYRAERSRARLRVNRSYGNANQRVIAPKFA